MASPRWRKVVRDLWGNKSRTILVILSIAVGVFAVGMVVGTRVVFTRELNASWASVNPASASLFTAPFDDELLFTIRNMPEVEQADGRRNITARFKAQATPAQSREGPQDWRNLALYTYPDYDDIRIFKIWPVSGPWPPPEHGVLIERASLAWMGVQVGDIITVEAPNGKLRELRVAGVVHDLTQTAASWTGRAGGYVNADTLEWLGLSRDFDELNIIVAQNKGDKEYVTGVAKMVRDKVEKGGRTVWYTWVPTPGKHPADEVIQPILLLMGSLGALSLLVSGFLVFNTLQALLAQQVRQIGIMKAVGARAGQIMGLYYGMVLFYGLVALAIAVPLGALAANALTDYMATLINFDVKSYAIPPQVFAIEIAVGLVVPLLAALYPIVKAVRMIPRVAMSDYGISGGGFGRGLIDRLLERVRGLSRPLLLSLRNTFRRKGRLALTLMTLTLGGAIFIAVFTVRASLLTTLDDMFDYIKYDVYVSFDRGYRIEQLQEEALKVPGVVAAEGWQFGSARRLRPDDTESDNLFVYAARPDSDFVQPTVVEGRWLVPADENAIVVNTIMLKDETDIKVGDDIDLTIDGKETTWRVVGLISGTPPMPMAYVNLDYYGQVMGGVGRAGMVFVQSDRHDAAFHSQLGKTLEKHFTDAGFNVNSTMASSQEKGQITAQFNVLVAFLLVMAILLAVVGAIGLMGTMSLNVLERTREIGVMRAIGASDGAILQIVIVEGVLIGMLSWLIGTAIAYPLSRVLSDQVGTSILQAPLSYTFSTGGTVMWLGAVLLLSALASFLPARSASRVTVREVLAYE